MSQLDTPPFDASAAGPQKTSGLAIASLVCSAILCCPVTTIIGPLLGVVALATIPRTPGVKGRGFAVAGILLGIVFTIGQFFGGYKFWDLFGVPMMVGPRDALTAGSADDIPGFKSHFYGPGETAPDAEAILFLDAVRDRYGAFIGSELAQGQQPAGGPVMVFEYVCGFEDDTVTAEVEIVFADEQTGAWPGRLGFIRIVDPDLGDLVYPAQVEEMIDDAIEELPDVPDEVPADVPDVPAEVPTGGDAG
jgi:hypothetical protein